MELNNTIVSLWNAALSDNTRRAYETGVKAFYKFLFFSGVSIHSTQAPVISEEILVYFIAHCYKQLQLRYSTIKLYLCGIRFHYIRAGITSPLANEYGQNSARITSFLKAVKRTQSNSKRARYPITSRVLTDICRVLTRGSFGMYVDCLMKAACTLAFFGFLRCGEFTVTNTGNFNPSTGLCLSDISIHTDWMEVTLRSSKTDPFRHGVKLQIHATHNSVCPVQAIKIYLAQRQLHENCNVPVGALFLTESNYPMSRQYFIAHLRQILKTLGLDDTLYNGHSFRIGAATSAGAKRLESHLIQVLGRWSSDCYQRYIHTSPRTIRDAQRALSQI